MRWFFLKIYLRDGNQDFLARQRLLLTRFGLKRTWGQQSRNVAYDWSLGDFSIPPVPKGEIPPFVAGRLFRTPKVAYGRKRNSEYSTGTHVDVQGLYDASEFIYDTGSCILAQRKTAPFLPTQTIVRAYLHLLGDFIDSEAGERDVYIGVMRDVAYTNEVFASTEDLREVKLKIVRPNPGGDDDLAEIELGTILNDTDGDIINYDEKKVSAGSLKKVGFIPRTINRLLPQGYIKSGILRFTKTIVDIGSEKPKERDAGDYVDLRNENTPLLAYAQEWRDQLRANEDIYPSANAEGQLSPVEDQNEGKA